MSEFIALYVSTNVKVRRTHACPARNGDSGVKKNSKMVIFSYMDNQITCQLPHISHRAWELRHAISSNMAEWTLEILVVL